MYRIIVRLKWDRIEGDDSLWVEGFTHDITGHVHYVDSITHELWIEVKPGEFERVGFDSVVGVKVFN